ncbi:glycosyltransferase family 2 protein [Patescibacteria group bacterium]|nr:glycosyltransferase family 2 protein [Patescibacteria group bacterium]
MRYASMDYLKIGKATDLTGKNRKLYRLLEILVGFLSWSTLIGLLILSYLNPIWASYFIIAFDIYWLLLITYLTLHLLSCYKKLQKNLKIDWMEKCKNLKQGNVDAKKCLLKYDIKWNNIIHLVIFPTYNESLEIIQSSFNALVNSNWPAEKMIVVLAIEERAGEEAKIKSEIIKKKFAHRFKNFLITIHPANIDGELQGKGANQAWAGRAVKEKIIDQQNLDYNKILVSIFDIDTIIYKDYFFCLTYKFLTVNNPYQASYQPIPVYHNNIWQAPFFARVAAYSNTFWQMMMQIRQEKLVTYSSHSMTFRALVDVDFWSVNMVSEDSRIFWHCFCYYNGEYRVEPLHFPVSMDATMDKNFWKTIKSLYKQQRRWGWGVENVPYLMFNVIKKWKKIPKSKSISRIFVQVHGFHSWATNALIVGVIGWMPILLGGNHFNSTVLSGNLPVLTRILMTLAMVGLIVSAIISTLLIPKHPTNWRPINSIVIILQWLVLPISIIIFGAFPALEAQTRLMFGKYMDFWVTSKHRV